jgi:hypothetical protein
MRLAIDDSVQKSLSFQLFFNCQDDFLRDDGKNPPFSVSHNYKEYCLKPADSLVYNLSGALTQKGDSLYLNIAGDDRPRRIKRIDCNNLKIDFGGMWIPGDFCPQDAMEGYNFNKTIFVRTGSILETIEEKTTDNTGTVAPAGQNNGFCMQAGFFSMLASRGHFWRACVLFRSRTFLIIFGIR